MKKLYEVPSVSVVKFETRDVITASGGSVNQRPNEVVPGGNGDRMPVVT